MLIRYRDRSPANTITAVSFGPGSTRSTSNPAAARQAVSVALPCPHRAWTDPPGEASRLPSGEAEADGSADPLGAGDDALADVPGTAAG